MPEQSKTFRLYHTFNSRLLTNGILLIMLTVGVAMIPVALVSKDPSPPGALIFLLVWIGFVLFAGYHSLGMPHVIQWKADNTVEFVSRTKTVRVAAAEIQSIKPGGSNIGYLEVRHQKGKVLILNQFDGFHEFLSILKEINPNVELRGC